MRKKLPSLSCLIMGLLCNACISEEMPNSECDIEIATIIGSNAANLFYNQADTTQTIISADSTIVFYTHDNVNEEDLKSLRIYFHLTEGATIYPENGSVQDFSHPDANNPQNSGVYYTVTSQDQMYTRKYHVYFKPYTELKADMHFEDFELENGGKYYNWFEVDGQGNHIAQWATGNPGFKISRSSAKIEEYPTLPWGENSISGHAVKLETCDTGPFGKMVNMRIAAGNLFIGTFDVSNALKDAMAATRFGLPFTKKPLRLKGYYQFMPGEVFQNRNGVAMEGIIDQPDIYGVFYKNTLADGTPMTLQGDNVLTHENIIAIARIQNPIHDRSWHAFDLEFDYKEEVDYQVLRRKGYNLAVVFTSSIKGAEFEGAVGSALLVDEVEVVCEGDE